MSNKQLHNIKSIPPLENKYNETELNSTVEDSLINLACTVNYLKLKAIEMNITLEKMKRSL